MLIMQFKIIVRKIAYKLNKKKYLARRKKKKLQILIYKIVFYFKFNVGLLQKN